MFISERQQKINYANQLIRRALYICKTIKNLSLRTGIARTTLTKIALGKHKGTAATRLRLQSFIEQNENKVGRPFK